jgi:hypothetical protein
MINQSVGAGGAQADFGAASEDISGAERSVQAQRDFANQLRGRAAPQGKTVGPSGLYVGPNWGESLEYAFNQGLGGYLSGKANKKDTALDAKRTAKLRAELARDQANKNRAFGQTDRGLDIRQTGQDIQVDQFGKTHAQRGSHFDQTLAQNQDKIDELKYQFGVGQGNDEREMALEESEVVPYLIDGKVVNTQKTMIEGVMTHIDPDTKQPIDIQGGQPLPTTSSSGRAATPKYPKTFYRDDGTRQETIMIGGTRQNVGGPDDGAKFERDGAREAISEEKLATELGKFEKRTEGTRQLAEKFNAANAVLEKFDIDIFSGDAPMGFLEQVPGFVGGAVRSMNDLTAADPQAAEKFSVINDVIAQLVREQAGLSQTAKEIETISNTYGRNWYDRPDVVAKAWPRLQHIIASDIASKTASTHGQVLNEYRLGLGSQGVGDWTRIGVGLEGELPPAWVPPPDSATGKAKADVDRRGRPKTSTAAVPGLTDEEEERLKELEARRAAQS